MNIFILDENPELSARALCDQHVVKMPLESVQMLCTPFSNPPYKRTHVKHPCSIWVTSSKANYEYLLKYARLMFREYTHRYGKVHKSEQALDWCESRYTELDFPYTGLLAFVQSMPYQYKDASAVTAYRNFYIHDKSSFARWNRNRRPPEWWPY